MSTLQARPPVRLLRPAVIEFRFNKTKAYKQQLRIFKRALKPAATEIVAKDSSCYFPITVAPGGNQRDLELRFVLLKKAQLGNTRTIVYWQVASDSLKWTSDSLVARHGFRVLEKIQTQPIDGSDQTLLANASDNALISANGSDRTLGLVVNPPYPLTALGKHTAADSAPVDATPRPAGEAASSYNYVAWVGCLVALLVGFMVGRLGRR